MGKSLNIVVGYDAHGISTIIEPFHLCKEGCKQVIVFQTFEDDVLINGSWMGNSIVLDHLPFFFYVVEPSACYAFG